MPAALAIGEEVGATLGQMLVAMAAGYEACVRIGRLGSPDLLNAGWQPPLAQHRDKLDELTAGVIGAERSARLYALIDDFDPATPVAALTALLRPQ